MKHIQKVSKISTYRRKLFLKNRREIIYLQQQLNYTGLQIKGYLISHETLYSFPKEFGALNLNLASEQRHHVRILRYSNLKVQKWLFQGIIGVHSWLQRILPTKTKQNTVKYKSSPLISILKHLNRIFFHRDTADLNLYCIQKIK